jgi:hypothetical protein
MYVWRRTSWGRFLVGLLQLLVRLFHLDWSRSIESAMLWPELDWYWDPEHKPNSSSFRCMYEEEHINFAVGPGSWLGCYSCWFGCFTYTYWSKSITFAMLWPELDWYWDLQHTANSSSFRWMYEEEHINFVVGPGSWLGCYSGWFGCFT